MQPEKKKDDIKSSKLPKVGDIFSAKVIAVDEGALIVSVPGFDDEKAVGVIKAEMVEDRKYTTKDIIRVEVIRLYRK